MKNSIFKRSALVGVFSPLFLLSSVGTGGVKDVVKPYLGVYECSTALLNADSRLEAFDYIRLELKAKEKFFLYYKKSGERSFSESGSFSYNAARRELTFLRNGRNAYARTATLEKGTLSFFMPLGEKNLFLQFRQT